MDGRVKTLHPRVHGGILARRDLEGHLAAMQTHDIAADRSGRGQPLPVRGDRGARRSVRGLRREHRHRRPGHDPQRRQEPRLRRRADRRRRVRLGPGRTGVQRRRHLPGAAPPAGRLGLCPHGILRRRDQPAGSPARTDETFPARVTVAGSLRQTLRYGENPHQAAAFYVSGTDARPGIATATQLQGKELSYNNLNDTDAAFELVAEFDRSPPSPSSSTPTPAASPTGDNLLEAYGRACECDPVSAFGGIIAVNRHARRRHRRADREALHRSHDRPRRRRGRPAVPRRQEEPARPARPATCPTRRAPGMTVRTVAGGFLFQTRDSGRVDACPT